MEGKRRFWYSEGQAELYATLSPHRNTTGTYEIRTSWKNYAKLDDGRVVPFTEQTPVDAKPSGMWPDYVDLGVGVFSHTDGRWCRQEELS